MSLGGSWASSSSQGLRISASTSESRRRYRRWRSPRLWPQIDIRLVHRPHVHRLAMTLRPEHRIRFAYNPGWSRGSSIRTPRKQPTSPLTGCCWRVVIVEGLRTAGRRLCYRASGCAISALLRRRHPPIMAANASTACSYGDGAAVTRGAKRSARQRRGRRRHTERECAHHGDIRPGCGSRSRSVPCVRRYPPA
jgi:hypothetical protein